MAGYGVIACAIACITGTAWFTVSAQPDRKLYYWQTGSGYS